MNLQAVLIVLVTGRVSHVRVVASEMPDYKVAHPSIPGVLSVGEPGWDPQLGDCHMGYGLPKPGGNASCQELDGTTVEKYMVPLTISSENQVTLCCNQPSWHIRSSVPR